MARLPLIKPQSWGTCPLAELQGDRKTSNCGPSPQRPINPPSPIRGNFAQRKLRGHSPRKELLHVMGQTSCISSLNLFLVSLQELPAPHPQCWLCISLQAPFCRAQQANFSLPSPTRKLPACLQIPAALPGPVLSRSLLMAEQIWIKDILRCHQSL